MISIGTSKLADLTLAQIAEVVAGPRNTPVSIRFQRQGPPFVDKTVLAIRGVHDSHSPATSQIIAWCCICADSSPRSIPIGEEAGYVAELGCTSLQGHVDGYEARLSPGGQPTTPAPPAMQAPRESSSPVQASQEAADRVERGAVLSQLIDDLKDILHKNTAAIGGLVKTGVPYAAYSWLEIRRLVIGTCRVCAAGTLLETASYASS